MPRGKGPFRVILPASLCVAASRPSREMEKDQSSKKRENTPGGIEQYSRLEIENSALLVSPTRRQGAIGCGWSRSTQSRNYSNVRTGTRQFENETKNELAEKRREEKHEERENEMHTCHENEIEKENLMLRRSPQARRSDFFILI